MEHARPVKAQEGSVGGTQGTGQDAGSRLLKAPKSSLSPRPDLPALPNEAPHIIVSLP
jgi:hypothetical protein